MKESKWRQLSRVDVSHGVEIKHGGLSYLSWPVAWSSLMDAYPGSTYQWLEPMTLTDGTMMVRCCVTVEDVTHEMQLPVLDHRNKPIANPNAFDFNSAQMRCLVKCIAMHGIGISLYLGDMANVVKETDFEKAKGIAEAGDSVAFHQFIKSLSEKQQVELFNGETEKGKKTEWKNTHRALINQAEEFFGEVTEAVAEAVSKQDDLLLQETISELSTYERQCVWARLDKNQQQAIRGLKA